MKLRNTNGAIVVLWQGKDGEPGLDVSDCFSKPLPVVTHVNGLHN